jgi:uncharacterized integral membrane protein
MGRALFSILSLIALAVIIVLNIDARTTFNLFGWQFENLAVPVLAIVSFVLGALYTFIFYLLGYFSRSRTRRLAKQREQLKTQEQTVKEQSQQLRRQKKQTPPKTAPGAPPVADPQEGGSRRPAAPPSAADASPETPGTSAGAETKAKTNPFRRFFGASSK